ncbi:MAG: FHA domain-containing protein [Thermoanaerobaculia bacterium]
MPARLTFYFADRPRHVVELGEEREDDEFLVGRDPECSIVLDDDRLSRRHARLRRQAAGWVLEDLGSKNGTLASGRRVESTVLTEPTWISFGGSLARFEPLSREQLAAAARERLERWQTSAELQRELDPDVGLGELLRRLLHGAQRISGAERAFVLLANPDGELTIAATRGLTLLDLQDAQFTGSVGAVELALAERRTIVHTDAAADPRLGNRPSIVGGGIRTLVCLPLQDGERSLGVLYADAQRSAAGLDELDVEILEALASHASLAIAVAQLGDQTRELAAKAAEPCGESSSPGRLRWRELRAMHRPQEASAS